MSMQQLASKMGQSWRSSGPGQVESGRVPSQLITWHARNSSGYDSGPDGEWLRCLKSTREGDRQYVWTENAVRAIVSFAGWVRDCGGGTYEGWGSATYLERPVTRRQLLQHPATRWRFDADGIRALQGKPIKLQPDLAGAIEALAGKPGPTELPLDEPDAEDPVLWVGAHGLAPEAYAEAAVAVHPLLWRTLGFPSPPERQVWLGDAGRCDLLAAGVVGEVKRVVTLRNGPDQIERYLNTLRLLHRIPRSALRGVLLQCADHTSQLVVDRLVASQYPLELWSVIDDEVEGWQLERLA